MDVNVSSLKSPSAVIPIPKALFNNWQYTTDINFIELQHAGSNESFYKCSRVTTINVEILHARVVSEGEGWLSTYSTLILLWQLELRL